MPTTGKMYFGSTLIAEPGMQWEYDRPYPPDYGTYSTWTIPGTLQQTFTTSGTYTPAAGVSTVHVAVIGGGGNGASGGNPASQGQTGGGSGGTVRVYRNVPVTGPVAVTIGGSNTESSFGALTASGGASPTYSGNYGRVAGRADAPRGVSDGGEFNQDGDDGVQINGTYYAGGGGGSWTGSGTTWYYRYGGQGGGGRGGVYSITNGGNGPQNGTNGLGGGGGGSPVDGWAAGLGGSGVVIVWSEDV